MNIETGRRNHISVCEDKKNMQSQIKPTKRHVGMQKGTKEDWKEEKERKKKRSVAHTVHVMATNCNENINYIWGIATSPSLFSTVANAIFIAASSSGLCRCILF